MSGSAMTMTGRAAALAALALLAACGSKSMDGPGLGTSLRAAATEIAGRSLGRGQAAPAAAPESPEQMAATALKVNPGPLVLAGFEGIGRTQVLAMTGDNRGMRTYMTENQEALILRQGLLVATRGLGNDLNTAEVGTEGLIRAQRAGSAQRMMRYIEGDGREHALPLDCTVTPSGGGRVTETCVNGQLRVQNNYLVSGGAISVSRQWIGQRLGYVTIQTIRP